MNAPIEQLTPEQICNVVANVFANTQGTLKDHNLLQQVLRQIEAKFLPQAEPEQPKE